MISIETRVALFFVAAFALTSSGCGRKVSKVELTFENDFAGLVVIRAKPDASIPFLGRVIIPQQGELNVSENEFYGNFSITATRANGTHLKVKLLSKEASAGEYALWWFPDGAYIRYFFLGRRNEAEMFYQLNKERLYRVEESRIKRSGNSLELNTER